MKQIRHQLQNGRIAKWQNHTLSSVMSRHAHACSSQRLLDYLFDYLYSKLKRNYKVLIARLLCLIGERRIILVSSSSRSLGLRLSLTDSIVMIQLPIPDIHPSLAISISDDAVRV